jgi:hypothetical protein
MKTFRFLAVLSIFFLASCNSHKDINEDKSDTSLVAPDTAPADHTATGPDQPGNYNGTATDSMHMDTSRK